jgi:hypothetical protein
MSGFRSNLSETIAAARSRATRSGDTLRSLLSPAPPGSSSASSVASIPLGGRPPGVTFATLGRQMAGLSTTASASSGEGEGGTGEFSLRVGGSKDLSIFVFDSEWTGHLCLGAVNGGIKFCLLPMDQCSVSAHSKKVEIHPSHVYINAGRNAAFTDPHAHQDAFGASLTPLLGELHPREDWLLMFQGFLDAFVATAPSVKALTTPRKRKLRYLPDPDGIPASGSLDSPLSSFSSWDMDQPDSLKQLATAFGRLESKFSAFQVAVGEDVDDLLARLHDFKAVLGSPPPRFSVGGVSEDCVTVWETLLLLSSFIQDSPKLQTLESLLQDLRSVTTSHTTSLRSLESQYTDTSDLLQLLSSEQETLAQIVAHGARSSQPSNSSIVTLEDFHALEDRLCKLESGLGGWL